jgi:hypothetical protein
VPRPTVFITVHEHSNAMRHRVEREKGLTLAKHNLAKHNLAKHNLANHGGTRPVPTRCVAVR